MRAMHSLQAAKSPRNIEGVDNLLECIVKKINVNKLRFPCTPFDCIPKSGRCNEKKPLPPIQTIFVDVESWNDDDSVLSLSSFESDNAERRNIFGSYWKNDNNCGKKDIPLYLDVSSFTSRTETYAESYSSCRDEDNGEYEGHNIYEQILRSSENTEEVHDTIVSHRRRIWGDHVRHSMSEVDFACTTKIPTAPCYKKSKSTSALHRTQQPSSSCLRESRFSGSCVSSSHQESQLRRQGSSVRFSGEDDVIQLECRSENWAADGWSDWFA